MTEQRRVEIFSAGCPACEDAIKRIKAIACPSCNVSVLDMKDAGVTERATQLGVRSVPAVAIDGELATCCSGRGPDLDSLKDAGIGRARP